jgi:Short C-terminal domain
MGLIGGLARTAAIAGTATAVSNRVSRRQARRWSADETQQEQQYGPPPQQYAAPPEQYAPPPQQYAPPPQQAPAAAPDPDGVSAQLERLADMKTKGLLTDDEFAAAKAKLLGI